MGPAREERKIEGRKIRTLTKGKRSGGNPSIRRRLCVRKARRNEKKRKGEEGESEEQREKKKSRGRRGYMTEEEKRSGERKERSDER